MGVLSIHNECPPLGYGPDTQAVCEGLIIGEEGTATLLRALADCLNALAAMDDTVGNVVATWKAAMSGSRNGDSERIDVRDSYKRSFAALSQTTERIDFALQKYQALNSYARSAVEAGRGREFQKTLMQVAGADFETLIGLRIEGLRRLKVRVKILQHLEEFGLRMLEENDSPGFFLLLMQPLRDMSICVNELYGEVVRGALASQRALFRSCRLLGEGVALESSSFTQDTVVV